MATWQFIKFTFLFVEILGSHKSQRQERFDLIRVMSLAFESKGLI